MSQQTETQQRGGWSTQTTHLSMKARKLVFLWDFRTNSDLRETLEFKVRPTGGLFIRLIDCKGGFIPGSWLAHLLDIVEENEWGTYLNGDGTVTVYF